jgi:MFS family permease
LSAAAKRSFAALSIFNYRLYFAGQLASLSGNWMQIVAELWLILELTGSGTAVGIATALQFAGIMLFGILGGALADRFDKRRLLIISQALMAAPALALFLLALSGSLEIWIVYALIAVRGLVLAVDNPARQAFVIEIVGSEHVVNAVGLNGVLVHSARIAGPALAGGLIALWGVTPVFALNVLTFGAMIAALIRMHPAELAPRPPRRDSYRIGEALRYVAATPQLRVPLILMAVLGTLGFNFPVIMPLLARFSFGGEVSAYSLLMVAMGAGIVTATARPREGATGCAVQGPTPARGAAVAPRWGLPARRCAQNASTSSPEASVHARSCGSPPVRIT